MITEEKDIEPIVPMGSLTSRLGCSILWSDADLVINHPTRGRLPVKTKDGCPQIPKEWALQLIRELEEEEEKKDQKVKKISYKEEEEWLVDLVTSHPVLRKLPPRIKNHLASRIGKWEDLPLNKRRRRRAQREGLIIHLYAGEEEGFTLERSWKQAGGNLDDLLEIDLKRGVSHDMLADDALYASLLRLAFDKKIHAVLGGPNCRSRSVLRHRAIPEDPNCPRPLRAWGGGEHGIQGLTPEEEEVLRQDDLLLWRMIFVFMVASYVRKADQHPQPAAFLLEQPASPKDYQPETVSWWDTQEWKSLKKEFDLQKAHCKQSSLGEAAPKPTTLGTTLQLDFENHEMKRSSATKEIKGSKDLARWAPGLMNAVSQAILLQIYQKEIKLKPLSWDEHIAHGHIPFRRDCWTCQQSIQQQAPHRRVAHPIGGVLSLDTVGPLVRAPDVVLAGGSIDLDSPRRCLETGNT